jgi:hypothetical protein
MNSPELGTEFRTGWHEIHVPIDQTRPYFSCDAGGGLGRSKTRVNLDGLIDKA